MKFLIESSIVLARASNGNPIVSCGTVVVFYFMFNLLEAAVETLIFGSRFVHWLDPIFGSLFIMYSAISVYGCAIFNTESK